MKLLECKDKLTINELLQIAFEYGNDNADMPADSDSITESFNEWLKSNDDLFKKLILPQVSKCEDVEREALLLAYAKWRDEIVIHRRLKPEELVKEFLSKQ